MRLLPAFTHKWALAKRDFRWLCAAALCYAIGNGGELVVVSLLVFEVTGSTGWVGGAVALYLGPQLLFGPVAGAFADWLPRRALLRTVQLALGINLTLIALLVGFTQISIWQILLISLVSGVLRSTYQPVRLSYTYDLVGREQAVSGLAIIQLSNRIGQGLGALVAGSAMQRLGPEYAYGFLAGLHLIAFVLLGSVHNAGRAMADEERVSLRQTFIDYKEEVRVNRNLLILIIVTATVNLFGFSFHTALPELATGNWGVGAEGLGLLHAARAVGGMLAMDALSLWVTGTRLGSLFLSVIFLFSACLVGLALAPTYAAAFAALVMVAAVASLSDVLSQSMMQHGVPDRLRGRAMGAWTFAIGFGPVGQIELGLLAIWIGADMALAANGAALLLCAVVVFGATRLRNV